MGEYLILFLLLQEETFFLQKTEIFFCIEYLMKKGVFLTGYCCNVEEGLI